LVVVVAGVVDVVFLLILVVSVVVVETKTGLSGRTPLPLTILHWTFRGKSQNPVLILVGWKNRPAGHRIRMERELVHA